MIAMLGILACTAMKAQDHLEAMDHVLSAAGSRIRGTSSGAVKLQLRGIYVLDGLLWFTMRVSNGSVIDWRAGPMRFSIRDRHVLRRRARQELPLAIVARHEALTVRSDSSVVLCYALTPRLPRKGQDLVLDYGERNGDRRMMLRLKSKDILKAKKLDGNANNRIPL